jgi:hypothetical protein
MLAHYVRQLTHVVPCFLRNGTALDPITGTMPNDPQDWFNLVYGMKGVVPDSTYRKMTDIKWWGMTTPKQFLGTLGTLLVSCVLCLVCRVACRVMSCTAGRLSP